MKRPLSHYRNHMAFALSAITALLIALSAQAVPQPPGSPTLDAFAVRKELRSLLEESARGSRSFRVKTLSRAFLGRPYHRHNLGEGTDGKFNQLPLYRFDRFDCVTFVETVVALAFSNTPQEFEDQMNRIRYANAEVSYLTRNHFPSKDWIPNTIAAGFFEDITAEVAGKNSKHLAKASATIDKNRWIRSQVQNDDFFRLNQPVPGNQRGILVAQLLEEASTIEPITKELPYIPVTAVLRQNGEVDEEILHRIPSAAVISFVRPNWLPSKNFGSHMNVSHQGFLIWKDGKLWLRHAAINKTVLDIEFVKYLKKFQGHPTLKGFHLLALKERQKRNPQ